MGELQDLVEEAFDPAGVLAPTYAVVVVQGGEVVLERHGGELPRFQGPPTPVTPATPLLSWSMAKSMLHAAVGVLVGDGRLRVGDPAPVPAWEGDGRSAITVEDLLAMRDGLAFVEDYVDAGASDAMTMLFGDGQDDMAGYAASRPLVAPPGTRFNYSSGSSNILSGIVAGLVGSGEAYRRFLGERLFGPAGMASASPGFDDAGTWVASSYVHATARDFARFGELYLRDGVVAGHRILPEGWVEHGIRRRSADESADSDYGAHWWRPREHDGYEARGYEGQSITVVPAADLVVVRLGRTPAERNPELRAWRAAMVQALA